MKKVTSVVAAIAVASVSTIALAVPSDAAVRAGVRIGNSSASDCWLQVCFNGSGCKKIDPGDSYTVKSSDSGVTVTVQGKSFRVRYDKTSGDYQGCQNFSNGAKTFTPSSTPTERLDILTYNGSGCVHA